MEHNYVQKYAWNHLNDEKIYLDFYSFKIISYK